TVEVPFAQQQAWVKFRMNTSDASPTGCSIYALRMEADYVPGDTSFKPLQVTFNWAERQKDRSSIERSHTQTVSKLPFKYTINVGGADHPVMNWLLVQSAVTSSESSEGYSDGRDAGGEKFVSKWMTCGKNLAIGKSYALSIPSSTNWDAGDPDG